MTKRTCPWCGSENLILRSCSGQNPELGHTSYHYWEDPLCGYKEKTSAGEVYNYEKKQFEPCEVVVYQVHKPRPPLPGYKQPEYLRKGLKSVKIPEGQVTIDWGGEDELISTVDGDGAPRV